MWRACLTLPTNSRHNTISVRRIAITCGVIIHCRTLFHIHTLPYAIVTFDLMSNQWSVRGPGNNWTQSGLRHHPSLPAFPSVLPSSVRPPIVYKCPARTEKPRISDQTLLVMWMWRIVEGGRVMREWPRAVGRVNSAEPFIVVLARHRDVLVVTNLEKLKAPRQS